MVTVILTAQLQLPGVSSLKEKRRVLSSMLTRIRNDFNVSIAEVGDNDTHRSAIIGAAVISNETSFSHQVIAKVVERIRANHDVILADYRTEVY
jgi:uncharacterized protein YlxP (DUF503 family)